MYKEMISQYEQELIPGIHGIDDAEFGKLIDMLVRAYRENKQVFIAGNGGSAATANHFVCDFGKNAVRGGKRRFRILSICDNIEKITALSNDIAFDEIFRFQLGNLMQEGDVLIVISASGNSPNVVNACEYAKTKNASIAALLGFSGGKVKAYADACLLTPSESYERIEDIHLIIMHMVVCFFKEHPELLVE